MRIYCDSNIFRKAKKTSKQFYKPVFNALEALKGAFLFLFSEAHLYDLSKSLEQYRIEDLTMMEDYVKNNYLSRNHIDKSFNFYLSTPLEAYENVDFEATSDFFDNPYNYITKLFNSDEFKPYGSIVKSLFDAPLFGFSNIENSTLPQEYQKAFEKFKGTRTINDALKRMNGLGALMESKTEYNKLRMLFSDYIDRNDYSYDKWAFEFDQKMKESAFGKSFSEFVDLTISDADKNDEYTNFINTYTQLEFLGITQEKVGSKNRNKKNSFWDIHKDAMHAYYAGKSDYFVTDDSGALTKAFITYKLLGIGTQVLSVTDFVNKSNMLLREEDTIGSFYKGISYSLKKGFIIEKSFFNSFDVIKLDYSLFNYFNRMQVNGRQNNIQFFKSYKRSYGIMYAEIDLLIKKCNNLWSEYIDWNPINNPNIYQEIPEGNYIRLWNMKDLAVTLSYGKNTLGNQIIVMTLWLGGIGY
jgi:hypothetical protein